MYKLHYINKNICKPTNIALIWCDYQARKDTLHMLIFHISCLRVLRCPWSPWASGSWSPAENLPSEKCREAGVYSSGWSWEDLPLLGEGQTEVKSRWSRLELEMGFPLISPFTIIHFPVFLQDKQRKGVRNREWPTLVHWQGKHVMWSSGAQLLIF